MHMEWRPAQKRAKLWSMAAAKLKNGVQLEDIGSFKYLEANLSKNGSSTPDVRTWITTPKAAMARRDWIWHSHKIRLTTKYKLYKSLVVPILLYRCDTWTLLTETERRIQGFENKSQIS